MIVNNSLFIKLCRNVNCMLKSGFSTHRNKICFIDSITENQSVTIHDSVKKGQDVKEY